jgi:hypothetical protein
VNLSNVTYQGPAVDDPELLEHLPAELRELLTEHNGFVLFEGGLHVRGACTAPDWHSLRAAIEGPHAFHRLYPHTIDETDIPFAQDCSGDQFVIRGGEVHQLASEVGEIDALAMGLAEFLAYVQRDSVEALCMHPLLEYRRSGGRLEPGRLLLAYPPFCTGRSGSNASLKDVPVTEAITFHADLARQISDLEDGDEFALSAAQ